MRTGKLYNLVKLDLSLRWLGQCGDVLTRLYALS